MKGPQKPANQYILGRTGTSRNEIGFLAHRKVGPGQLIRYAGDGHLITFAPTGTGKTSGPVICNALKHPAALIVLDMKGEIYAETAETRRAMGQEVHVIDLPDDAQTGSLNPLDLVARCGSEPAALARGFAADLIERGTSERDRFWNDWAETMISGGTAWLLADCPPEERRISRLFDLFMDDYVVYRMACLLDEKKVQNRAARTAFALFLQLGDNQRRPSVLGTVQTHLRLFTASLAGE